MRIFFRKYIYLFFMVPAIYYLLLELVTILYTANGINSYFVSTISSLSVPYRINEFSRMYMFMSSTYIVNCIFSLIAFATLTTQFIRYNKILYWTLVISFCLSLLMLGVFHCEYKVECLHLIATIICFLSGNLLIIFCAIKSTSLRKILPLGIIGIVSGLIIAFTRAKVLLPLLERGTIYPIVIAYIIIGISMAKNRENYAELQEGYTAQS